MGRRSVQRNTRQREVILEELRKLSSHPTAVGLYEIVRQRLPRISLGTVYRNLDLLATSGAIQKLDPGGSQARFDGNVDRHDHVRCVGCGRVDDLCGAPLDLAGVKRNDCNGYEVLGYRLEFVGVCPRCREQSKRSHDKREENESC
ncbi:MAG: Fur family transcriptional regulator [Planctomycetota bacterium]|jgi:Fur family ferric uptake transcriptional regulator